jgi:hypothetical protein
MKHFFGRRARFFDSLKTTERGSGGDFPYSSEFRRHGQNSGPRNTSAAQLLLPAREQQVRLRNCPTMERKPGSLRYSKGFAIVAANVGGGSK